MEEPRPLARLQLTDTWNSRDLPVLVAISSLSDELEGVDPDGVAVSLGLSSGEVLAAIQALVHGGLLHEDPSKVGLNAGGEIFYTMPGWLIPSAEGRRAVGLWPSEETALDRMVEQLKAIANDTGADETTRSRAKRILDTLLDGGRDLGIAVAAAVITGQIH